MPTHRNVRRNGCIVGVVLLCAAVMTQSYRDVHAEVIHIPVGQQAPENRNLPRPQRGDSQDTVLARFGEPLSISPPVGEPPISKWQYEDFTVYFEHQTVIHSVLMHKPKYPIPPAETGE